MSNAWKPSIIVAVSGIGEAIMRSNTGCRAIMTLEEQEKLLPIFEEVYENAVEHNKYISRKIKPYLIDSMEVNACAIGRHSLAVTKGAMELLDKKALYGFIAHEFGHISHYDSMAIVVADIGNWFFTALARFLMYSVEKIDHIGRNATKTFIIKIIRWVLKTLYNSITFVGDVILMYTSRVCEYKADKFAFAELEDHPLKEFVHIAAYYGMRRSELIGLRWSAIDFNKDFFIINHTVVEYSKQGKQIIEARDCAKTDKSVRPLPLTPFYKKMFLEMREKQKANRELMGNSYCNDYLDYVFMNPQGVRYKPKQTSKDFKNFLKKKKLRVVKFHSMRHTTATMLHEQGESLENIAKWLGHANSFVTETVYTHFTLKRKLQSAEALTNLYEGIMPKKRSSRMMNAYQTYLRYNREYEGMFEGMLHNLA